MPLVVVLSDSFGASRPYMWPRRTSMERLSTAVILPKRFIQTEGLNDHSACHAHRVIADRAVDLLSAAQSLEGTDEYKRLQTAFLERGMID